MICLLSEFDETLEWMDAFTSVSGLAPSDSAMILAELTGFESTADLFIEIGDRVRLQASLDDEGQEEFDSGLVLEQDENLEDEDLAERFAYYRRVMEHHGFSEAFYKLFRQNLSPSSELRPKAFKIARDSIFETSYNDTPYFDLNEKAGEDLEPEGLFDDLMGDGFGILDQFRLVRPINPVGWINMMTHLGFEIKPVSPEREEAWFPRFNAFKDATRHPIYIGGPSKAPYDDEDEQANEIKSKIIRLNTLNPSDIPIVFWSSPLIIGEGGVPYWGEIYYGGKWHELFMTEAICQVKDMLEVSGLMEKRDSSSYNMAVEKLCDKDRTLVSYFMKHHIDPVHQMMGDAFGKFKK